MKQGMRVAGWALGMVLWGCLGGATGLAATDPALANFQAWAKNYVAAPASVRPGLEAEGLKLATARRPVFQKLIQENPRNYIAQPTLKLSTAPALIAKDYLEPRHLDLRPFILQSKETYVTTGGLTRVAMKKGSLVVNSSQGGGSKDTWIVESKR